jgi:hypothetical protein
LLVKNKNSSVQLLLWIPLRARRITSQFAARLNITTASLADSLQRLCPDTDKVEIVIDVNGPMQSRGLNSVLGVMLERLSTQKSIIDATIQYTRQPGKIRSVNTAIARCPGSGSVMILDEDIVIPSAVMPEIFSFIRRRPQRCQVYCFQKSAVLAKGYHSEFHKLLSFLNHPSTMRLLAQSSPRYTPRPSGSLYVLLPGEKSFFPDPCNEAEVLIGMRYQLSIHYIRTWYPETFHDESLRRYRQSTDSVQPVAGVAEKNADYLAPWSADPLLHRYVLPLSLIRRLEKAVETRREVLTTAARLVGSTPG